MYHDDCTFETYTAGQSFTDLGCGDIHNVRNETGAEAKDIAVQIVPHDAPDGSKRMTQVAQTCFLAPHSEIQKKIEQIE